MSMFRRVDQSEQPYCALHSSLSLIHYIYEPVPDFSPLAIELPELRWDEVKADIPREFYKVHVDEQTTVIGVGPVVVGETTRTLKSSQNSMAAEDAVDPSVGGTCKRRRSRSRAVKVKALCLRNKFLEGLIVREIGVRVKHDHHRVIWID